jgi:uncharacterized membrane protein YcaP (DUF421 family)
MEEQNEDEECCDDNVEEQCLDSSWISQQIRHVSVENHSELVTCAHLSLSCNL